MWPELGWFSCGAELVQIGVCVCVLVQLWFSMDSVVGGLLLVGSAWVQLVVTSGYIIKLGVA